MTSLVLAIADMPSVAKAAVLDLLTATRNRRRTVAARLSRKQAFNALNDTGNQTCFNSRIEYQ
jgi:CTP:molybdopterin cytidylyltransferase MocA